MAISASSNADDVNAHDTGTFPTLEYEKVIVLLKERRFAEKFGRKYRPTEIKAKSKRLLSDVKTYLAKNPEVMKHDPPVSLVQMMSAGVEVVDYYDELQEQLYQWLYKIAHRFYIELTSPPDSEWSDDALLPRFQLAMIYLRMRYRRPHGEYSVFIGEFMRLEAYADKLYELENAQACRLAGDYYYLRSRVARHSQQRYDADKFLDLAATCSDMEARLDKERASDILTRKMIVIGLERIWLLISKGLYSHAQELLKLVSVNLTKYDGDLITRANYLIATNLCRRALAGRDKTELGEVIRDLSETLNICDGLEHRRYVLRCYHERSMCYLLLGGSENKPEAREVYQRKVKDDLMFMEKYASAGARQRPNGWHAQLNIMHSRLAAQREEFTDAEEKAIQAMDEAFAAGLDLLVIEAKNTLAVTLFRQKKYGEAERYLHESLRLNHEGLGLTDQSDLSQPSLYGLSLLYLARVAILKGDSLSALSLLQRWRAVSARVEHRWVRNLASEVEQQVMHQCLVAGFNEEVESLNVERQVKFLHKVLIERASRKAGSSKIQHIADELQVRRQTIHQWIRDLKKENLSLHLEVAP
jgi:hypothetical protein